MLNLWSWFPSWRARKHPCIVENERQFKSFDRTRSIEDYDIVCFDTELTGLNLRTDQIVSIGAIRIRDLRIVAGDSFFAYLRPTRDLPKVSTLVHRITPQQIERAPKAAEVLPRFVEYCSNSVLLGHYVVIDLAFLGKAIAKTLGGRIRNPSLDSVKLAAALHVQQQKHQRAVGAKGKRAFSLNKLAVEYGLPLLEQHDALEDAIQTAYLFLFLATHLRRLGYTTLNDFLSAGSNIPDVF
ncbi:MAG: 3'-5' exonuclease [Desulfomonilaceae bacterium]